MLMKNSNNRQMSSRKAMINNQVRIENMKTQVNFETFEKFLVTEYARGNDGKFFSSNNYKSYLRTAIKDLNIEEYKIFTASSTELKALKIKLEGESSFLAKNENYRRNILSSFGAIINYKRYLAGYIKY